MSDFPLSTRTQLVPFTSNYTEPTTAKDGVSASPLEYMRELWLAQPDAIQTPFEAVLHLIQLGLLLRGSLDPSWLNTWLVLLSSDARILDTTDQHLTPRGVVCTYLWYYLACLQRAATPGYRDFALSKYALALGVNRLSLAPATATVKSKSRSTLSRDLASLYPKPLFRWECCSFSRSQYFLTERCPAPTRHDSSYSTVQLPKVQPVKHTPDPFLVELQTHILRKALLNM